MRRSCLEEKVRSEGGLAVNNVPPSVSTDQVRTTFAGEFN